MKPYSLIVLLFSVGLTNIANPAEFGGRIVSARMTNAQICLLFETTNGCSYQVQANSTLTNRFWRDALPLLRATGSLTSVLVPALGANEFFRVLEFTNRTIRYDWGYYDEASFLSTWGFGAVQNNYASNDRAYDWYIDQADTGFCAGNNCGPSSVTMAIKWYSQSFRKTAEDARNTYPQYCASWYTDDIINYLNRYYIPNTTHYFNGANQLTRMLDQGNLVILCISTLYLTQNFTSEHRVGRFSSYAGGHFLVLKGYRVVDNELFFEVYDAANSHAVYADGTPKGRNRHLPAGDLVNAIAYWWKFLIVIPSPSGSGGADASAWSKPVDPSHIVHMPGS